MLFPEPETALGTLERHQVDPEVIPKRNAILGHRSEADIRKL